MSVPPDDHTPRLAYEKRLSVCAEAHRRAKRAHDVLAWARVVALLGLVVTSYERCSGSGGNRSVSTFLVVISLLLFVALSVAIGRAVRRLGQLGEAERYYQLGLARLDGKEEGFPFDGRSFEPTDPGAHPYAVDLDLFGPGSLFSRVCTARTTSGQATLASWLLHPAGREQALARQEAVTELSSPDRLPLREEIWRGAGPLSRDVKLAALDGWLRSPVAPPPRAARIIAASFSLAAASAILAFAVGQPLPFLALVVLEVLFARRYSALVEDVARGVEKRAEELKAVAQLAAIVERESFTAPRLRQLQETLREPGPRARSARKRIEHLVTLVDWFESRRNPFFAIVSAPFLVITQLAFAIARWRQEHGAQGARWLETLGELEALISLASYASEHPRDIQPEIAPDAEGPMFDATGAAHPLLPEATRVGNDVRLDGRTRLLLVTGSNMSGKSTLLRTVGTCTVLALAGAPVPARRLRLSRLEVGASLRTVDSLQAGVSRFFAEIKRLRTILELAEKSPLTLFLLDEILHGTNSEDRFAGAQALVEGLVERGAIGLCTTHDLTLARIVDDLAPAALNVHFEDVIADGKLSFDYKLRSGVVTRGNALALMHLVGLPVKAPGLGKTG